jgi:hypothetical protein
MQTPVKPPVKRPYLGGQPTHACAVPGCTKAISTSYLMCIPHWRLLDPAMADTLWFAWRMAEHAPSPAMTRRYGARLKPLLDAAVHTIQAAQPAAKP